MRDRCSESTRLSHRCDYFYHRFALACSSRDQCKSTPLIHAHTQAQSPPRIHACRIRHKRLTYSSRTRTRRESTSEAFACVCVCVEWLRMHSETNREIFSSSSPCIVFIRRSLVILILCISIIEQALTHTAKESRARVEWDRSCDSIVYVSTHLNVAVRVRAGRVRLCVCARSERRSDGFAAHLSR